MTPSNHLILCRPLLLRPSIFPSIQVFSNESVFQRWKTACTYICTCSFPVVNPTKFGGLACDKLRAPLYPSPLPVHISVLLSSPSLCVSVLVSSCYYILHFSLDVYPCLDLLSCSIYLSNLCRYHRFCSVWYQVCLVDLWSLLIKAFPWPFLRVYPSWYSLEE